MIDVLIIETKTETVGSIADVIENLEVDTKILSVINTIEEAREFFKDNLRNTTLLFLDERFYNTHLHEVLSLKLVNMPVVITGESEHNVANTINSPFLLIDHVLKPVNEESVKRAISRCSQLMDYFNSQTRIQNHLLNSNLQRNYRTRLLVRKADFYQYKRLEEIACIFTNYKIVFLLDIHNNKYMTVYKNLSILEDELDPNIFFRANRKCIININSIISFKPACKVKLAIKLNVPMEDIIVSQLMAPRFKAWITEENLWTHAGDIEKGKTTSADSIVFINKTEEATP